MHIDFLLPRFRLVVSRGSADEAEERPPGKFDGPLSPETWMPDSSLEALFFLDGFTKKHQLSVTDSVTLTWTRFVRENTENFDVESKTYLGTMSSV